MADAAAPAALQRDDRPSPRPVAKALRPLRTAAPWGAGAAALAGIAWMLGQAVLVPSIPAEPIVQQDLISTVVASGRVQTPYRARIGSQITGVVDEVPVAEGQRVVKGQVLVRLRADDLRSAAAQADADARQASARLAQMEQVELPAARLAQKQTAATLANAALTYDRMRRLTELDSIARADFDNAAHALDTARAQDEAARLQVSADEPGGTGRRLAEAQLASAIAAAATAHARLAFADIKAPSDGVLIGRNVERGDVAAPGATLLVLSPSAETQLVINLDEKNLGRVAVGQQATVSADAFPDRRFPAEVIYVNPAVDAATAAVEVKLRVRAPPVFLRQDMTVSVDILSATRKQALTAPAGSVRRSPAGRPYVLAFADGRVVSRPVEIGVSSGSRMEVLKGLRAGEWVFPATAKLTAGQRVRIKARV